jgi:hypothetical protein
MKPLGTSVAVVVCSLCLAVQASAQQPATPADPHHPATPSQGAPAAGRGMPMVEMCRQMMGEMPGMSMMGGAAPTDPKERAAMLEMRGEMMKSMGDIMMKHARRMQGGMGR